MATAPQQPLLDTIPEEGDGEVPRQPRHVCEPVATFQVAVLTVAGIGMVVYMSYVMWVATHG